MASASFVNEIDSIKRELQETYKDLQWAAIMFVSPVTGSIDYRSVASTTYFEVHNWAETAAKFYDDANILYLVVYGG